MKNAVRLALCAAVALSLGGCFGALNLTEADLSDPGIKARLDSQLQAHKNLDLRHVAIDVHSRIVTMSGLVSSEQDKILITRIVNGLKGVDQAVINLIVQE